MLPSVFLDRMKELLGENFDRFFHAYQNQPTKAIHLNRLKWNEQLDGSFLKQPIEAIPNAYFVDEKLGNHPYHHAGLFYSQEPSAMIPASTLTIPSDAKVLDLCAAPGGKTFQLSEQVPNGFVISNEMNYSRAKKLLSNVERLGLTNVVVTSMSAVELSNVYEGYFDVVLLDAPCSGEGMFRKDHDAIKEWSMDKVKELSLIQKNLMEQASKMLKTGGYLIYSTCTFSLEENEKIIYEFLKQHNYSLEDVSSKLFAITADGIALNDEFAYQKMRRCYPYIFGEGQFVALLKKNEKSNSKTILNLLELPTKEQQKLVELAQNSINRSLYFKNYKGKLVIVPNLKVEIPNLRALSCFITVGEIEHNEFIPHHQFIKAYGCYFKRSINLPLTDVRVELYLKGFELLEELEKGYGVLMVDGLPLGLIKSSQGKLKNHYPKGLRIR